MSSAFPIPFVLVIARAVLPPWGDRLVDIVERVYGEWDAVVEAAKDGWTSEDDDELAAAVSASIRAIPAPPGSEVGDAAKLGDAAAVLVRWIVASPKRARSRKPLFPKLAAKAAERRGERLKPLGD